jgi:hypothetical protein
MHPFTSEHIGEGGRSMCALAEMANILAVESSQANRLTDEPSRANVHAAADTATCADAGRLTSDMRISNGSRPCRQRTCSALSGTDPASVFYAFGCNMYGHFKAGGRDAYLRDGRRINLLIDMLAQSCPHNEAWQWCTPFNALVEGALALALSSSPSPLLSPMTSPSSSPLSSPSRFGLRCAAARVLSCVTAGVRQMASGRSVRAAKEPGESTSRIVRTLRPRLAMLSCHDFARRCQAPCAGPTDAATACAVYTFLSRCQASCASSGPASPTHSTSTPTSPTRGLRCANGTRAACNTLYRQHYPRQRRTPPLMADTRAPPCCASAVTHIFSSNLHILIVCVLSCGLLGLRGAYIQVLRRERDGARRRLRPRVRAKLPRAGEAPLLCGCHPHAAEP